VVSHISRNTSEVSGTRSFFGARTALSGLTAPPD
jgi:hypothetical protein